MQGQSSAEEMDTLRRKQRQVISDRQRYVQDVQQTLAKQGDSIASLKKENDKLKQELGGTVGGVYRYQEQDRQQQQMQELEALERRLNFEKLTAADLEKNLTIARMDLRKAYKIRGGVNAAADNSLAVEKQVRILENRLDQALVQFNEALGFNRRLREQIDSLRGERKVFMEIYKRLEGELHEKKKSMADVIEKSNRDYEDRDALQAQLEKVKEAARVDSSEFDKQFEHLDNMLAKYKAARESQLQQKSLQEQQAQQAALKAQSAKQMQGRSMPGGDDPSVSGGNGGMLSPNSTHRGKRTLGGAVSPGAGESLAPPSDVDGEGQEEDLLQAIEALKGALDSGHQDIDQLHVRYLQQEERNFSTFNFVNEQNALADQMEDEIGEMEAQLGETPDDAAARSAKLRALETELAQTEQQHDTLVSKSQRQRDTLDNVRATAKDIFNHIKCDPVMAEEVCGSTECTELNMLTFFGVIEHRTEELLRAYHFMTKGRAMGVGADGTPRRIGEDGEPEADEGAVVPAARGALSDPALDDEDLRPPFIGGGPDSAPRQVSARAIVMAKPLPQSNAGDTTAADGDENVEEDAVIDHAVLRQKVEETLKNRKEKMRLGGGAGGKDGRGKRK